AFAIGLALPNIGDMHDLWRAHYAAKTCLGSGPNQRFTLPPLDPSLWRAIHGACPECFAIVEPQVAELRFTQAVRVGQDRFEDRLQIAGRAGNDLLHLRRCSLLLQSFAEIVGALAQLAEQAGGLDGDHRLTGEMSHQRDLLVTEWADLLPVDGDHA